MLLSSCHVLPSGSVDLNILRVPSDDDGSASISTDKSYEEVSEPYFVKSGLTPPVIPKILGMLKNIMVHPDSSRRCHL